MRTIVYEYHLHIGNVLCQYFRSFVAHVAALCACECKQAYLLSPPNHQPPFGLRTTTRTINIKKHFYHRTSEAILIVLCAKLFLSTSSSNPISNHSNLSNPTSNPFQPLIQSQNASCANYLYDNKTYKSLNPQFFRFR